MTGLTWYMQRLRKMPVAEVPYRLQHWARKKHDKRLAVPSASHGSSRTCRIRRIELSGVKEVFPDLETHIVSSAESILSHRFNIFGIDRDFGDPVDWHLDPKTGNRWPLVFWGDIDYRDGQTVGGIKFAWEVNRLHHLPVLAIAFQITEDHRYQKELFTQLQSWLDGNPYPRGINWISGIEIAIRIVNVIYSLRFLGYESSDAGQQKVLTSFVSLSARHLYRYRSRYSSCANHAVAEALGLFAAGLCFPDLEGALEWKKLGREVLECEITRQICPDGSSFEHSVPYLQFVSELFLAYLLLCQDYGEPCGEHIRERLKTAFEFLSTVTDTNGNYPRIGDGDDSRLLKLNANGHGDLSSLLNIGAVLFDCPTWIIEGASYDLMTFCLLGSGSKAKWERLKQRAGKRPGVVHHFADAGLLAIRDEYNMLFVGNGSRLGLEPLGGHGHADCLSFWLSVKGQPIIVDPGTYLYHSGGRWRDFFRSTSAHSTIAIDGQDQASMISDFMFGKFYHVRQTLFDDSNGRTMWSVEHDGYARLEDPVVHGRTFTHIKSRRELIVEDLLTCRGTHAVTSLIQLHPDCLVSLSGGSVDVHCGTAELNLEFDGEWESIRVACGQQDHLLGWYSPRFNETCEAPTLVCCKTIKGATRFTLVIRVID